MKRSLFIAIAVLIVMALFVGCKAEIADRDELVEVTIAGGARALTATGTMDVDVADLYWYFSATKNSGLFKVGETEWEAVTVDNTTGKGIANGSLGQFSKGSWTFCFYGFTESNKTAADKAAAVYYQTDLSQNISGQAVALTVSLTKGVLPSATIEFTSEGITWTYAAAGAGLNLEMEILDGTTAVVVGANNATRIPGTDAATAGSYVFTLADSLDLLAGNHEFTVNVYNIDGTDEELVGQTKIKIVAVDGMKYVVSGNVEITDELTNVTIGGTDAPVVEAAPVVILSSAPTVVETNNTPANASNAKTSVSFPQGALDSNTTLTVETSSSDAAANSAFQVSSGEGVVAAISLSLADGTTSFNGEEVTITTYIEKNLTDVSVHYNGNGAAPTLVRYTASSGELVFTTTHFSEFFVTSKSVAKIGEKGYGTFRAALDAALDGETITMLQDAYIYTTIKGGRTITIDMGDNVLTGSFDVRNANVTLKNGTFAMSEAAYLIGSATAVENYSVLTIASDAVVKAGNDWTIILWPCLTDGAAGYGTVLNVYGTVDATEHADALWVTGNCAGGNAVINIYDGATVKAKEMGIALNGFATVNVEDGAEITSEEATAIEVRAGNLNITGGTFKSKATPTTFEPNGNGTTTKGVAVAISQHTTVLPIAVNISGGSFYGYNALWQRDVESNGIEGLAKISLTVTGGSFYSRLGVDSPVYIENAESLGTYVISDSILTDSTGTWFEATGQGAIGGIPVNPGIPMP